MTMMTEKLALRPSEVAATVGLSRTRVYELIHSGELPAFRVGTRILVATETLKQWLADQEAEAQVALPLYTRR